MKSYKLVLFGSLLVLVVALLGSPLTASAITYNSTIVFTNPTPAATTFGSSVSISGDKILVGAHRDETGADYAESVYLYDTTTGELQTIKNPTSLASDYFGLSVSISGDKILVGAHGDDRGAIGSGAAYLFGTDGILLQTFINPTPKKFDHFGLSLSISGNNILIGGDTGAAYLFDATTGNLLKTINNPTAGGTNQFGSSVSISGNNILIGGDTGAYLFDATTGNLLHTFNHPTAGGTNQFGKSVSISGNNILIGEPGTETAYLFDATTGNLLKTINNPTPATKDYFGTSVSISGNNILVGAPYSDTGANDAGAAYLFDATTGNLLYTFQKATPNTYDYFGNSVSISGNNVLVGVYDDDTGANDAGAAYLFLTNTSVPYLPTNLIGTTNGSNFTLSWDPPFFTGGSPITDYKIEYRLTSTNIWSEFTHTASNATKSIVTGLANDQLYVFRVSAINSVGTGNPLNFTMETITLTINNIQTQVTALSTLVTQLQIQNTNLQNQITVLDTTTSQYNSTLTTLKSSIIPVYYVIEGTSKTIPASSNSQYVIISCNAGDTAIGPSHNMSGMMDGAQGIRIINSVQINDGNGWYLRMDNVSTSATTFTPSVLCVHYLK